MATELAKAQVSAVGDMPPPSNFDLAADGASNRQIAEHLFITQATVETHLRHAFRKLNITSRAELPPNQM